MKVQNFRNHIRFYPPHHFVYYPVLMLFLISSIYFAFTTDDQLIWTFLSVAFVFLFCLAYMLRQHYALTLQNRIIKTELEQNTSAEGKEKLAEFNQMLEQFNVVEKPDNMIQMLAKGKEFLNNPLHSNK